ncbi:MAG: hypothetical protein ACXVQ3_07240 [Gaiellaceae bacterium]
MAGAVLLHAARRLALIYGAVLGATVVLSTLLGVAAGASLERSIAVGLYVSGALLLVGCFVVGARGPLRGAGHSGETVPLLGARRVRRATSDERNEASRTAVLLFVLGLTLIVLGSLLDPAHKAF